MKQAVLIALMLLVGCRLPDLPDKPAPKPKPVVTVDSLYVVTVDDALARDAKQRILFGDTAYWRSLESRGHRWSVVDAKSNAADEYKPLIDGAGGPPVLILTDAKPNASGKRPVLETVKLPADKAGIDAEIKKFSRK